ncbi:MAG: Flp pilus assembly protein CpaB [Coriobacteriales bacterium]
MATITSISAFLATGCLIFAAVTNSQANSALASVQADMAPAVVAVQDIPSGATIEASMLASAEIPARYLGENSLHAAEEAIGKQAVVRIDANTPLRSSELTASDASSSLAGRIAKGMKAVSINVSTETDFAQSLLHQGDRVSLYCFDEQGREKRIASDVEVLALDGYVSYQDLLAASGTASYSTVSVQVTQEKAEEIRSIQAADIAIWMVLSSSADIKR